MNTNKEINKQEEREPLKYNSPYPSVINYTSDKGFMVRLKAMIERRSKEFGVKLRGDQMRRLVEYITEDAESCLFASQSSIDTGVEEKGYANNYVCGFYFDHLLNKVVLIWKEKPAWQKGKLNGVGGKIESGESPITAMIREFKEETSIDHKDWKELVVLSGEDWIVHFFYAVGKANEFEYAETQEEEEVAKIEVDSLDQFDYIPNLQWLIPLAIYKAENPKENIVAGAKWASSGEAVEDVYILIDGSMGYIVPDLAQWEKDGSCEKGDQLYKAKLIKQY